MSYLTKIIDFFRPTPSIIKFSAVPNYEPEEVKPKEVKATRMPMEAPVKLYASKTRSIRKTFRLG